MSQLLHCCCYPSLFVYLAFIPIWPEFGLSKIRYFLSTGGHILQTVQTVGSFLWTKSYGDRRIEVTRHVDISSYFTNMNVILCSEVILALYNNSTTVCYSKTIYFTVRLFHFMLWVKLQFWFKNQKLKIKASLILFSYHICMIRVYECNTETKCFNTVNFLFNLPNVFR